MNKSIQGNANGIVEQAKQTVANVAADAKEGVTTQLEQKIDQAKGKSVEKIETVSEALRGAGEKLEGTGPLPELANKAAQGIENLANYFETKTVGDLFRGVEGFARRQPAAFIGGAFAVGILAGRFLKSSSRRSSSQYAYSGTGGEIDQYETFGYEGSEGSEYGSEGDYLSADELEDDWDTGVGGSEDEPMAFQSDAEGIGISGSPDATTAPKPDTRMTQPQVSSAGSVGVGSETRGNTEKMPVTQGSRPQGIGFPDDIKKSDR